MPTFAARFYRGRCTCWLLCLRRPCSWNACAQRPLGKPRTRILYKMDMTFVMWGVEWSFNRHDITESPWKKKWMPINNHGYLRVARIYRWIIHKRLGGERGGYTFHMFCNFSDIKTPWASSGVNQRFAFNKILIDQLASVWSIRKRCPLASVWSIGHLFDQ